MKRFVSLATTTKNKEFKPRTEKEKEASLK